MKTENKISYNFSISITLRVDVKRENSSEVRQKAQKL